ncbi:MAG: signal-transduction protein [Thaumarchaeota archaeon CSP1-1]|nr:MAG: signal-transduction protein [Thaumarchaeota archaeon CSP1-1]
MGHDNLEKSLSKILVRDIMSNSLISADPSTTVYQIAKLMEKGGVGAIIVKKDNIPAGIITDRDFAIKIASQKYPLDTPVHKVASYPLQTINANESILVAADLMSSKKIRKLAVVENNKVVGIITSTNLVNQLAVKKDNR